MLADLAADNQHLTRLFRAAHAVCERHNDVATTSLIEVWIDRDRAADLVSVRGRGTTHGHACPRPRSRR